MTNKVAIYFTHKESLGHTSRVRAIVTALIRMYGRKVRVRVFHAGKPQRYIKFPDNVAWVDLPSPYFSRASFYQRRGGSCGEHMYYARQRQEVMLAYLRKDPPDVFVTEFFPFGRQECRFELLPVISYLKKAGVRICASIGYPFIVRDSLAVMKEYNRLYDRFLIHTPEGLEEPFLAASISHPPLRDAYREVLALLYPKTTYTGYILPVSPAAGEKKPKYPPSGKGKKMVLVSRGGGVIYPKIITHAILAAARIGDEADFSVLSGPSTSKSELAVFTRLIRSLKKRRCTFSLYRDDFPGQLAGADVSVSMAGYNTAVQLLRWGTPSVLVPSGVDPEVSQGYCSEQLSRAELLRTRLPSRVLEYNHLTAEGMECAIREMLKKKRVAPAPAAWFEGAQRTAGILAQ